MQFNVRGTNKQEGKLSLLQSGNYKVSVRLLNFMKIPMIRNLYLFPLYRWESALEKDLKRSLERPALYPAGKSLNRFEFGKTT